MSENYNTDLISTNIIKVSLFAMVYLPNPSLIFNTDSKTYTSLDIRSALIIRFCEHRYHAQQNFLHTLYR